METAIHIDESIRSIYVRICDFNAVISGGIKVFNAAGTREEKLLFQTKQGSGTDDPLDVHIQLSGTPAVAGKKIVVDFSVAAIATDDYSVTIGILGDGNVIAGSSTILRGKGNYDYVNYTLI